MGSATIPALALLGPVWNSVSQNSINNLCCFKLLNLQRFAAGISYHYSCGLGVTRAPRLAYWELVFSVVVLRGGILKKGLSGGLEVN